MITGIIENNDKSTSSLRACNTTINKMCMVYEIYKLCLTTFIPSKDC